MIGFWVGMFIVMITFLLSMQPDVAKAIIKRITGILVSLKGGE